MTRGKLLIDSLYLLVGLIGAVLATGFLYVGYFIASGGLLALFVVGGLSGFLHKHSLIIWCGLFLSVFALLFTVLLLFGPSVTNLIPAWFIIPVFAGYGLGPILVLTGLIVNLMRGFKGS